MKFRILLLIALFANGLFAQEFHDTQGKLEIANSGQANFTLPIAMPSSIKDVGPIINLTYTSGQSGGMVVYQTCGFRKIKSKRIDNQFKLKNKCNNKDDQSVVFIIFNTLNQL